MKKFLFKISFSLSVFLVCHIIAAFLANGSLDPFYLRFTTPKQKSLVIGTSRAAQGIQPYYINKRFERDGFELPIFNFSFTIAHSPFGPVYYEAIKKKLEPGTKNGLYIISVDPWAISAPRNHKEDTSKFIERDLPLGKTQCVSSSPNFEYLLKNNDKCWGEIIYNRFRNKTAFVQNDGWLEITVPMDGKTIHKRTENKAEFYRKKMAVSNLRSKIRIQYLKKTIQLLGQHGSVVLVRLPVSKEIKNIEDESQPDFDHLIQKIAEEYRIPYFNFINNYNQYRYTDGNHLCKISSKTFSIELSNRIKYYFDYKNDKFDIVQRFKLDSLNQ